MIVKSDSSVVDVARKAGVSVGTVSRVMNRRADVRPDVSRKVLFASREIGFIPKVQHRCISVVTSFWDSHVPTGYATTMVGLLTRYLSEYGYTLELVDAENIELAYQAHVRGAIAVVFDQRINALLEIPNLPILTINEPMTEQGIHSVCADHYQQSVLATEYLLSRGHRRIAFLEHLSDNWGSCQRRAGYEATLRKAGITPDESLIRYTSKLPLYDSLARWIRQNVTALLNFSESTELETIHILTNILRFSIPEDISVISMEDMPVFQYLTPPQTVIRQPMEELARTAVDCMVKLCNRGKSQIKGETKKEHSVIDIKLSCELIERESVADRRTKNKQQKGDM